MGKLIPKKTAENMARLRKLGIQIAIVVVMLSGWLIFFSQKAPVVPPPGQPSQQGQRAGPGGQANPAEPAGNYVLSYFIVLMCIGLGLLVVTRASNRRDRARPEQYQEKTDMMEGAAEEEKK